LKAEIGDKVRLKAGSHRGRRAVIRVIEGGKLWVQLDDSKKIVQARAETVINYSLAARKAWKTEPNRGVGRPKGTRLTDRVSVTLRLDRELWERFQEKEEAGTIEDRPAVINQWFREKLSELDDAEPQS
jgi:hypothetical protein